MQAHERRTRSLDALSVRGLRTGRGRLRAGLCAWSFVVALASCSDATGPGIPVPTTLLPGRGSIAFTALGQTQSLAVSIRDQAGAAMTGVTVTWSSSADSVATVTAGGLVTAVGNGAATITATAGDASAQVAVSVAQVPVSLTLSAGTAAFAALGDTLRLSATVEDSGGSPVVGASVQWSIGDTLVARVAGGLVTASGNGTTYVVASAGAAFAIATVRVSQAAASIMLSADSVSLAALGDTATLTAMVSDGGGSQIAGTGVVWASSDTLVARVSAQGTVTAVANGTAMVTATSGAAAAQAQIVVRQVAAIVALLPDSVVLKDPGDTAQLSVTAHDARGWPMVSPSVTWMSADSGIAAVDSTGLVTAVGTGMVVISADVDGTIDQGSARVEPEVTLVAAGPTAQSGEVAGQLSLSVRVQELLGSGYEGTTISWSTGPASGTITSGATTQSGPTGHSGAVWVLDTISGAQQATASIESRGNLVQVAFTATALPGAPVTAALVADSILLSGRGETAFLGPTYRDQYGNVTPPGSAVWQSRDPAVASVSPDGLVTAGDEGATYVVAMLGSPTDSLLVTVAMRGAITVTFDDGFVDADTLAFPVLQALGLRGNIAVNPAQVIYDAYISEARLDVIHAAGWSIVSHSMTHDSLTTTTAGELDWELRASQQWIDARGYNGSNVFVVPYHDWGVRERNAVGTYYEAARGTSIYQFPPDTTLVSWRPSNPYDLTGIDALDLPYTSPAGRDLLRDLLQRTVDEGVFLDLYFHGLGNNLTEFQLTMDVVNEFRERVLPYHELYPRFARSVF